MTPPAGRPTILLLGATSDMARAVARTFAASGYDVRLAGRSLAALEDDARDLRARTGAEVQVFAFDVLDTPSHAAFVDSLPEVPQVAVCAVGLLGDQQRAEHDWPHAETILRSNFEGPASIVQALANRMADRGSGIVVGISSVAGERGRRGNYLYGAAKAGFTAFLSGLRNRLAGSGVHVLTVKPGFVHTRMTSGLDLPAFLTATPGEVAEAIFAACRQRRNVIYVRPLWRLVMAAIRLIPEPLFKRTNL